MGAWSYVKPRLETAMRELGGPAGLQQRHLRYVGRTASASVGELTRSPPPLHSCVHATLGAKPGWMQCGRDGCSSP